MTRTVAAADREERLLWPVAGGGEAVGPETHPGEEGDEGDPVEDGPVAGAVGRAHEDAPEPLEQGLAGFQMRGAFRGANVGTF